MVAFFTLHAPIFSTRLEQFFFRHFLRTSPLNLVSIGLKVVSTMLWGLLDNPALLGAFSLMNVPSSIMQRGMVAGAIAQNRVPALSHEDEESLLKTTMLVESVLMLAASMIATVVFFATGADIVHNLGAGIYFFVATFSLLEIVPSVGGVSCVARRRYFWNFLIANSRTLALIGLLAFAWRSRHESGGVILALLAWAGPLTVAALTAVWYFRAKRLGLFRAAWNRTFVRELLGQLHSLAAYRAGVLLFGNFPGLVIAYMKDESQVGLIAFALTLSNFVYQVVTPVMEQIYSPTIGILTHQPTDEPALRRTIVNMAGITLLLSATLSLVLYFGSGFLLRLVGKTHFLGSLSVLPYLLGFQIALSVCGAFTQTIFGLRSYALLSLVYLVPVAIAGAWVGWFRADAAMVLWSFPILGFFLAVTSVIITTIALRRTFRSLYV